MRWLSFPSAGSTASSVASVVLSLSSEGWREKGGVAAGGRGKGRAPDEFRYLVWVV